ncbi:TA system antitoxin ParD family protein [Aliamphritea hakodatensis]|uniref:TA system antitoxin ParD family protein n=1 Tax=Aliamphritea hakodatensis TaxID=2895352 RepID=UPI0022FD848C|nr:hypothetical protein [Aliamphritea hakodatensis]
MSTTITLDDAFVEDSKTHAQAVNRSTSEQIEHWIKIGKVAEDNPDLTYEFIRDAQLAQEEVSVGKGIPYVRRTKRI